MTPIATQNILEELKNSYIANLPAKIDDIESSVLKLEREGYHGEAFETLYRDIHSMKGSGGTYGFNIITTICHQFEDFLEEVSASSTNSTEEISNFLVYVDLLKELAEELRVHQTTFENIEKQLTELKKARTKNKISGIIIEPSNASSALLHKALTSDQVTLALESDGIAALNRLAHEKFDFLITASELINTSGMSVIAATRLGKAINKNIKCVLITSNNPKKVCDEIYPDKVFLKDSSLLGNLSEYLELLKNT